MTEKSPQQKEGHWDNPNPPPDDPKPTWMIGPNSETRRYLNAYYRDMNEFQKVCGRFPLTSEGFKALAFLPRSLKCTKFRDIKSSAESVSDVRDGWKKKLKYISDGKSFKIEASHGYFVNDQSPHKGNEYWENSGTVVDDPEVPIPQDQLDLM